MDDCELFTAETLSMAVIVLIVGMCLAEDRLAPLYPGSSAS